MKRIQSAGEVTIAAFLLGFMAMVGQLVLLRALLGVFNGNELLIAVTFVFWFLGIATGAWTAGWLPENEVRLAGCTRLAVAGLPALAIVLVTAILLARIWLGVAPGQPFSPAQILPVCALGVFPYAFGVGLSFPVLAAWGARADRRSGPRPNAAGWIYWLEATGSLAGGLLFTFVWAGRTGPVCVLWACLVGCVGYLLLGEVRQRGPAHPASWGIGLALLLLVGAIPLRLPRQFQEHVIRRAWEAMAPGFRLLSWQDSRYQFLSLGERDGQYCLYLNGLLAGSFPEPFETSRRVHLAMNQQDLTADVLLAGQGLEGETQAILAYPCRSLTVVYLDPAYPDLILPFLDPPSRHALGDSRLRQVSGDLVAHLRRSGSRHDLIILHPPPPVTAAFNRFYTEEFFKLCRDRLRPGGVLTLELAGADNFLGPEMQTYLGTVYQTLAKVFPRLLVMPGQHPKFIAARPPGAPTIDPELLYARLRQKLGQDAGGFTVHHFRGMLEDSRAAWLQRTLEATPGAVVNTDRHPVVFWQNLQVWDLVSGGTLGAWSRPLASLGLAGPFGVMGVLFAAIFLWVHRRRSGDHDERMARAGACLGVWTAGLIGMGLEIVLVYQFQTLYGYVYSSIGLLFAGFMLGLAGGAWFMNRQAHWGLSTVHRWAFVLIPAGQLMLCLSIWTAYGHHGGWMQPLLLIQVTTSGTLTGLYFPAACRIHRPEGDQPLLNAARMDSLDHLGALAGAGLTGLVFLPVLGIDRTMLLFCGLAAAPPLWAALARWTRKPPPESTFP